MKISLDEVFKCSSEEIIESIGQEYSLLDIKRLRLILIIKLKEYDLLIEDDTKLINTNRFWNDFNNDNYPPKKIELANDLLKKIIISLADANDLNSIIGLYNDSENYRIILDDIKFLHQLMEHISDTKVLLITFISINNVFKTDHSYDWVNNFEDFKKWYTNNVYTSSCNKNLLTCLSGALSNGFDEDVDRLLEEIKLKYVGERIHSIRDLAGLPPKHILFLINNLDPDFDSIQNSNDLLAYIRIYTTFNCDELDSEDISAIKEIARKYDSRGGNSEFSDYFVYALEDCTPLYLAYYDVFVERAGSFDEAVRWISGPTYVGERYSYYHEDIFNNVMNGLELTFSLDKSKDLLRRIVKKCFNGMLAYEGTNLSEIESMIESARDAGIDDEIVKSALRYELDRGHIKNKDIIPYVKSLVM